MIDTIKGYIIPKYNNKSDYKSLIELGYRKTYKEYFTISFNLSNIRITVKYDFNDNPKILFFNGSLHKFYNGNNFVNLDLAVLPLAIEMFSDKLSIDMSNANITRVDYGINFKVNYAVHNYISCLMSFPRLQPMRFSDSITFFTHNGYKSILFYDKLKEIKRKDLALFKTLSSELKTTNVIRYEIQLKKRLNGRLGVDKPMLKDLTLDTVQYKLRESWLRHYGKVNKIDVSINPIHLLYFHNGLYKYLSILGLQTVNPEKVLNIISELKFDVKNSDSKRSQMKSVLKKLLIQANEYTLDNNLINELNSKIYEKL